MNIIFDANTHHIRFILLEPGNKLQGPLYMLKPLKLNYLQHVNFISYH